MTELLERWLEAVVSTPGMTGLTDREEARRALLDDAMRGLALVDSLQGAVVDVGSGGGSPGIPLAASLPDRSFTLLEAQRRKCAFLEVATSDLPNITVVWGRAEAQPVDVFGVAVAKALAKPPVAAELCLPLVMPGGAAILWIADDADPEPVAAVASQLGGTLDTVVAGLAVIHKVRPTPPGFPRRPGMAKKRPLT